MRPLLYLFHADAGEPKAIPWTHVTPIRCGIDAWAQQDVRRGDVVAWPTNLGWMMGPWLLYAALLNGATIALFQVERSDTHSGHHYSCSPCLAHNVLRHSLTLRIQSCS